MALPVEGPGGLSYNFPRFFFRDKFKKAVVNLVDIGVLGVKTGFEAQLTYSTTVFRGMGNEDTGKPFKSALDTLYFLFSKRVVVLSMLTISYCVSLDRQVIPPSAAACCTCK